MRVAILSGKGGTGKTFTAVNLAAHAQHGTYIDCDVEAPNGRLFFNPDSISTKQVTTPLPSFDSEKCVGCRKCVDFCHFNALVYIKNKPMLFPDICHGCGGCMIVCTEHAISETQHMVGMIETGYWNQLQVITGILNTGEASGIPVIREALKTGFEQDPKELVVIDCPPGSSCAVMESVAQADYCIGVVEPTAFGLHNFQMIQELLTLLHKPFGIVINKAEEDYLPLESFCNDHEIPILAKIPYEEHLGALTASGKIAVHHDKKTALLFSKLLNTIEQEIPCEQRTTFTDNKVEVWL